jgi:hypothetical protein
MLFTLAGGLVQPEHVRIDSGGQQPPLCQEDQLFTAGSSFPMTGGGGQQDWSSMSTGCQSETCTLVVAT